MNKIKVTIESLDDHEHVEWRIHDHIDISVIEKNPRVLLDVIQYCKEKVEYEKNRPYIYKRDCDCNRNYDSGFVAV